MTEPSREARVSDPVYVAARAMYEAFRAVHNETTGVEAVVPWERADSNLVSAYESAACRLLQERPIVPMDSAAAGNLLTAAALYAFEVLGLKVCRQATDAPGEGL